MHPSRARGGCSPLPMPKLSTVLIALSALAAAAAQAGKSTLIVATFPDLDRAAKAAAATWAQRYPQVALKIVSLQYADHHTAMTTALATGSGLPDVMALDFRFIGKFAASGGLQDLAQPPFNGLALRDQFVRYSFPQAINAKGALAAIPADKIGRAHV